MKRGVLLRTVLEGTKVWHEELLVTIMIGSPYKSGWDEMVIYYYFDYAGSYSPDISAVLLGGWIGVQILEIPCLHKNTLTRWTDNDRWRHLWFSVRGTRAHFCLRTSEESNPSLPLEGPACQEPSYSIHLGSLGFVDINVSDSRSPH